MNKAESFFLEAVQFVPIITLASSFIVRGEANLEHAAILFEISAVAAIVITAALTARKVLLNPILLGTNLWLCIGAVGFGVPITPLAEQIGTGRGFGLYLCVLAVEIVLTASASSGGIGLRHPNKALVRRLSLMLLGLTAIAAIWSFLFMESIRLGGALPFIILNVSRRMLIRRSLLMVISGNTAEEPVPPER